MNSSYLSWLLLCVAPACIPKKHIKKVTIPRGSFFHESHASESPPITVWIHVPRFIRRPLFYSFFNGTPSIRLAQDIDAYHYLYQIARTLSTVSPHLFPLPTFYIFGWSGKLSSSIRQEAARYLYAELQRIVTEYKHTYNKNPIIRLLTHSHGGTVALNLARVEKKETDIPLKIDELVLMACPVQKTTKKYIQDKLFKHTSALYSGLDMLQVLAPQVTYTFYRTKKGHLRSRFHWPPFSHKRFKNHPKLAQVKIKMNGRALFHTEFTSQKFISILPHVLHVMHNSHKQVIEDDTQLLCVYTRDKVC